MKVKFYKTASGRSPVEDFIKNLSISDRGRFLGVFKGIKESGFECPRVKFRQLYGKLWEIKFGGDSGKYRIAYVLADKDLMIWLHAFKKTTQKTPKNDLALAEKRMVEVFS